MTRTRIKGKTTKEVYLKKVIKKVQEANNYPGVVRLIALVQEIDPSITRKEIKNYVQADYSTQLTKTQNKETDGRIVAFVPNELWQFDIIDMKRYEKKNDGYKYIFCCIDVFTRKAFVEPMMQKDSPACLEAFKEILKRSKGKPRSMISDQDGAFLNEFQDYCEKEGIVANTNALHDHKALGILDNFVKRIRLVMTKRFLTNSDLKWTDFIQKIVDNENKRPTKVLGDVAPNKALDTTTKTVDGEEVQQKNEDKIVDMNIEKNKWNNTRSSLEPGDKVRKSAFLSGKIAKGTDPRWSDEVFEVQSSKGNTVRLTDGSVFKRQDLLKVPSDTTSSSRNLILIQKLENRAKSKAIKVKRKKPTFGEALRQLARKKAKKAKETKPPEAPVVTAPSRMSAAMAASIGLLGPPAAAAVPKRRGRPPSGNPPNPKFIGLRTIYGSGQQ